MDFLHYILQLAADAVIAGGISLVFAHITKSNRKALAETLEKEHVVVHLPQAYRWIGVICSLLFVLSLLLMIAFPNDTAEIWVGIVFGIFIIMGVCLFWAASIWRIHIYRNDDFLIYISSFGGRHHVKYKDIDCYKNGASCIRLRANGKMFFVDSKATNVEALLEMLKRNCIEEAK